MLPDNFQQSFNKNRTDKPLYQILSSRFHNYILKSEHNTRFPSERELALEMKVNRRTIRKALEPFLKSGRLVRRGKETYINHELNINNGALDGASYKNSGSINKTMTILLPETMPDQINFWNGLIEKFNHLIPTIHLKALFCGIFDTVNTTYWEYIQAGNFDLALFPPSLLRIERFLNQLMPIKPSWKKLFHSDEFISGILGETVPLQNEYAYTYMFTFQRLQWLKQYHLFDGVPAGNMPFEEMLRKSNQFLPKKISLFNIYYDICRDLGVPVEFTPKIIQEHCNIILDRLKLIKERERGFFSNEISYGELNGDFPINIFCNPTYSNSIFFTGPSAEEKYVSTIYRNPRQDCYYWGGCGMIGIAKHTEHVHHALLFIEFLLSKSVQDKIWQDLHSAPVRTESLATINIAPEKEFLQYITRCRQNPASYPPPVGCTMMPYFEQYLEGKITEDKIIQNMIRFYE